MAGPVVVGYDGSPGSLTALHAAVRTASLRRLPLRIVVAWQQPPGLGPRVGAKAAELIEEEAVRTALYADDVARRAGTEVATEIVTGLPGHALIERSCEAELVVVGAAARAGLAAHMLGTVTSHVVARSRCNVLVAREQPAWSRQVVVAFDRSPAAERAVSFAVAEARVRGMVVLLADCRRAPDGAPQPGSYPGDVRASELRGSQERGGAANAAVAGIRHEPGVDLSRQPVGGAVVPELLRLAYDSDLVVLGGPRSHRHAGRHKRSVAQQLAALAQCSVAVVR